MPEPAIVILAPAFDAVESAQALEMLEQVTVPAVKFCVTRGKFETSPSINTLNADAGYPAAIGALQTLASMAGTRFRDDPRFRDGYDLFCIRQLLKKHGGFDRLLLLRRTEGVMEGWRDISARADAFLFAVDRGVRPNLTLDLVDPRMDSFLAQAWTLYVTGAAYAIPLYGLGAALGIARDAVDLVASCKPRCGSDVSGC